MKFSVLLPTRNGLDFLKYAIISVLKQEYDNWEIIISDNASSQDIKGYVHSLHEPRIKYSRSEEFLSVTQNWNRCLDQSTGDYVIMLGDDDFLLKNYFQIAQELIEKFEQPDLIYTSSFLYAYPNVLPDYPRGIFQTFGSLNAMPQHEFPFWLELDYRLALVQQMLRFRPVYGTNMQHALVHRTMIEKIKQKEKFFHSPYPDFYAMTALFINAKRVLIYPKEIVVIGITPKSHGYYFFNKKEKEGIDFLNVQKEVNSISSLKSILLPGSGMLTFWLCAMETLNQHFSLEQYNLKLDYLLYRREQINHVFYSFINNREKFGMEFKEIMKYLSLLEKISIIFPVILFHNESKEIMKYLTFLEKSMLNFLRIFWFSKKLLPKFLKEKCKSILGLTQPVSETVNFMDTQMPIINTIGSLKANPLENRFSNALEIFEQIEPIDNSIFH